ncbi:hypothetical protein [Streptomyces sp. V1I6]|uniref:hypothetical protein n=1 Tax=Streptomyces sp. V1I6 TaxID=3042273 RepID=UPI002784FBC0|nr:hypothetical protein [Streptomyces sp. V1I6]MDQ0842462.1 hypothetical protein [Streptomyces sp. V1I6]
MAAPIERLDVPLPVVEEQVRTAAGCQAEQQHLLDPADPLFARLACKSDCCSTDADYPGFAAWLADRIAKNTGGQA